MSMRSPFVFAIGVIGVLVATAQSTFAQDSAPAVTPQTGVVLVKLASPVYPPLARQARIMGDVKVLLTIRQDGTVESAELLSGHPMLKQAALDSAKKSQFECRGCNDGGTSYSLTYTFAIGNECRNTTDCSAVLESPPEIQQSLGEVMITVDPLCTCDPVVKVTRLKWRSAKCLYLWRCGSRVVDSP